MSKKMILSAMLLSIFLFGCRKHLTDTKDLAGNGGVQRLTSTDPPDVENGMLKFRDGDHLVDYLNFLDACIVFSDSTLFGDTVTGYDKDSILLEIETGLGYTSLRSVAYSQFETLNQTGWSTLDEIPEIHYIKDMSMRSVFNSNGDVLVGTDKIHLINEDIKVKYPADNSTLDLQVSGLGSSATVDDLLQLSESHNLDISYNKFNNILRRNESNSVTSSWYNLTTPNPYYPEECTNPKKVRLKGALQDVGGPTPVSGAHITINWGDGTAPSTTSTGSDGIYSYDHTYSSFGTYTVTVTARLTAVTSIIVEESFDIDVKLGSCYYMLSKASGSRIWHNIAGVVAWNGDCAVYHSQNLWGININRIIANTGAYMWLGGSWKSAKGLSPSAEIWCDIYSSSCGFQYQKFAHDYPGGSSSASINTGLGSPFGWTLLTSRHRIYAGGDFHYFDIELSPCD